MKCSTIGCREEATVSCVRCGAPLCEECYAIDPLCGDCENYTYCEICDEYVPNAEMADDLWCKECAEREEGGSISIDIGYEELEAKYWLLEHELEKAKELLRRLVSFPKRKPHGGRFCPLDCNYEFDEITEADCKICRGKFLMKDINALLEGGKKT